MRIKRFVAPDMRQALRRIRDELGPDAVILSNGRCEEGIEVTAAVDHDLPANAPRERADSTVPFGEVATPAQPRAALRSRDTEIRDENADDGSLGGESAPSRNTTRASRDEQRLDAVSEEVRGLRSLLELQLADLAYGDLARRQPGRATLVRQLGNLGLTRTVARAVAEAVPEGLQPGPAWKAALEALAGRLRGVATEVADFEGVVALLGPTGVGKTTTIAKIAARHVLRYGPRGIALVTTDSFRVGAHEQLRTFGRIMDIPVRVANDAEELRQSLAQFGDKRLVLVDTAGISQRDVRFAEQVGMLRSGSPLVRVYLVLSAACQWLSLDETLRAFGGRHVDGAMLTKLDESSGLGGLLSVLIRHELPVAYLSDGQRVPEDLEPVDPQRLVARAVAIMNSVDQRLRADGGSALEDRVADGQL